MKRQDSVHERGDKAFWLIRLWPVAALALMCAVFFWDEFWLPADRTILGEDAANMFFRWLRFAVSSVQQGQFPLWNPYLFSGLPFVTNPQPALFYPPSWLALIMPVSRALGLVVVLHVWLAGAGMYVWLRSEEASAVGALFGSVVFAFSGYFFVRVRGGHLGHFTTWAWLPLILWVYHHAVERRSWKLATVGGLPVGLSFLGGNTALFIYVSLGLIAYATFCSWESWQKERSVASRVSAVAFPMICVGVMLIVGLALAAVQILPMAELALRSTRQATPTYDFAARFSWPPGYLLTLLVPNFFGEPTHVGYWGDGVYDEFIYYVGILPLLLALLGIRLRHRLTPFLSALGLGALLLAFGEYGILHRLFYRFVPLFRVARAPARAAFLFTLAAAALAGLTVTALQSSACEERKRLLAPLKWRWVLALAGGALAVVVMGFMAFAWGRESNPAAGRLWHQANQIMLFLLFLLLSAGLLMAWRGAVHRRSIFGWLALGLVVLDLWTFGSGVIQVREAPESAYWRIVAQAVEDPQAYRVLPWGLQESEQNGGMPFGLRSVFGYDPLTLQRYEEFITSWPDPRARTYDLLNAGYLVTTAPQEFSVEDYLPAPRLLLEESGVWVYERPGALPRAWVVPQVEVLNDANTLLRIHEADFDPRATALLDAPLDCEGTAASSAPPVHGDESDVKIVRYEGNRIEAQVRGGGGLLVFSEIDYPGWRATLDGEPVPTLRADYVLRALCVPAGEHRVVMTYAPPLFKIGLAITGLTLLLIIAAAWAVRRRGDTV